MDDPSSGSRPGSTSRSALVALRAAGFDCTRVEPVAEQGWASWAYVVDGRFVVRFPRDEEIVDAMHREMRLLPALAAHVSFRVPEPVFTTLDWFVYELISGRPFAPGDDVASVEAMIAELHTFPADEAAALLRRRTWREQMAWQWTLFESLVLPVLPDDLADEARARYVVPDCPEALVHNDLGTEHLLVDEDGRAVGVIDFEDAIVGDPEIDVVPLHARLGWPLTPRMAFYRWVGSMHAVLHHVTEDEPEEVEGAIAELRRRLDAGPRR